MFAHWFPIVDDVDDVAAALERETAACIADEPIVPDARLVKPFSRPQRITLSDALEPILRPFGITRVGNSHVFERTSLGN